MLGASAGTAVMGVAGVMSNSAPLYIAASVFAIAGTLLLRSFVGEEAQRR